LWKPIVDGLRLVRDGSSSSTVCAYRWASSRPYRAGPGRILPALE